MRGARRRGRRRARARRRLGGRAARRAARCRCAPRHARRRRRAPDAAARRVELLAPLLTLRAACADVGDDAALSGAARCSARVWAALPASSWKSTCRSTRLSVPLGRRRAARARSGARGRAGGRGPRRKRARGGRRAAADDDDDAAGGKAQRRTRVTCSPSCAASAPPTWPRSTRERRWRATAACWPAPLHRRGFCGGARAAAGLGDRRAARQQLLMLERVSTTSGGGRGGEQWRRRAGRLCFFAELLDLALTCSRAWRRPRWCARRGGGR